MAEAPQPPAASTLGNAPLSDAEVVERVCAGETALFEVLMRRYNQRIYRCVRSILRDEAESEDAMQQAYLSAFRHLAQFRGSSSVATWLTRIAVNAALGRLRLQGRVSSFEPTHEGEDAMSLLPSTAPDPEQHAIAHELRHVLEASVDALPASYRTVFVLREVEGLSTLETAESLGLTEPVVKTRLHRAKAQLREDLYVRTQQVAAALFPFGASRCDRLVSFVLARLGDAPDRSNEEVV